MKATVELADVRGNQLRLAAVALATAAAVWPALPAHPSLACPLRSLTGIPCPMCGMTRGVVAAVHGDILGSLRYNPAAILVVALVAFVIVRARLPMTRAPAWVVLGLGAALWIYNVTLNPTF
jgi:hypothetical protein